MSEELFQKMVEEYAEQSMPGLSIRYTKPSDAEPLKHWFMDPEVASYFPMDGEAEINDAVMRWVAFHRIEAGITVELDGVPCGMSALYLQAYRKLVHQAEFGIIVAPEFRNKGIGTFLLKSMMRLAKEKFKIELLHLNVYAENPAYRLYHRLGFREFGRQTHWIKESNGRYVGRIFMERFL